MNEHKETDDVAGAARAALDPRGADDEGEPVPASEPEPREPPPERVAELAEACVRYVAARYGVKLDFSPDTLSFVDQWVRDAREELPRRPELADLVQVSAGAYLGEVIRLAFGGNWLVTPEPAEWLLCLSPVYCAFNPVGMVREALLLEAAEGWHGHFRLDPGERDEAEARLSALPAVEEDEFFAPSTRFDVVSILVEALRAGMQARGLLGIHFALEDYD